MSEKCGYVNKRGCDCTHEDTDCDLAEAIAHLKALILAQACRSEVSDKADAFVKAHE